MSFLFCKRKRSWRHLKGCRTSPQIRRILLFLILLECFTIIWVTFLPVRFISQAYSGWEYEYEDKTSIYGVKLRLKDGEIDFYKTEKILQ